MALPEPWLVLLDTAGKIADGSLLDDLAISCLRALLGIALALATAVPLGLMIGAEEGLRRRLSPFIYLLYPVPHVVLLPLIIILFGIGNFSKIFLIALIVFFQIFLTTRDAAKNIHRNYFLAMQTLMASRRQIYRHVILPATLPKILTAMRISIGTAVAILFFVESFATTKDLGYIIMDSWGRADMSPSTPASPAWLPSASAFTFSLIGLNVGFAPEPSRIKAAWERYKLQQYAGNSPGVWIIGK